MNYREINKNLWMYFFNFISRRTHGQEIELHVSSREIGAQTEKNWIRTEGFSYEVETDVLYIYTAQLAHPIAKPRQIFIGEAGSMIKSINIQNASEQLHVIQFRQPLQLEERSESLST